MWSAGEFQRLVDLPRRLFTSADQTEVHTNAFIEAMRSEPVGRLHLEKIEMTPVGVEQGELVASVALAPKESTSLAHREWATRTEEFETLTQDFLEGFSETGVAEKQDLSQATNSEQKHQTAFSLSGTVSYAGSSATIGYQTSSADQASQTESRQRNIALTRKASSRAREEHKQSFRVVSTVGRDDQSVRTITNPSRNKTMRVDYFQMIRKWKAELYRYGIRMTYDVVIPSPGRDLIRKLQDIEGLNEAISHAFTLNLDPLDLTPENWQDKANEHGVSLDEWPPTPNPVIEDDFLLQPRAGAQASPPGGIIEAIDLPVGPDYEIVGADLRAFFYPAQDQGNRRFRVLGAAEAESTAGFIYQSALAHLIGRSGDVAIVLAYRWLATGWIHYRVDLELRDEAYRRWQFKVWGKIRDGAERNHYARRELMIEKRDALLEELKSWDALTLRKLEREEIMKGVLRWLLGPTFTLTPADLESLIDSTVDVDALLDQMSQADWLQVMDHGELIKFLHNAIEWENVLFFTYPYFWDARDNWDFKRFLKHPDPVHKEFLRSGAARVVLTIRPGFEMTFAEFMEAGTISGNHPYVTIATEIQNFANTTYPGIPPANPNDASGDDTTQQRERGVLIGRWYEYTPTSALDIAVNTSYATMA